MIISTIGDAINENYKLLGDEVVDISLMSKQDIRKMVDNCTRKVKYNPDIMWFDYQALFDKTRDKVFGKTDNIEVKHVDFTKNSIAKNGVFDSDEIETNMLNKALEGDLKNQINMANNIWKCYLKSIDNDVDDNNNGEDLRRLLHINRLYFITVNIALNKYDERTFGYYLELADSDFVPTYFAQDSLQNKNNDLIKNMNFYAITRPVMGSIFFDKNFY